MSKNQITVFLLPSFLFSFLDSFFFGSYYLLLLLM